LREEPIAGLTAAADDEEELLTAIPETKKPVRSTRTVKKKKRKASSNKKFEVQVIPATKGTVLPGEVAPKKRTAAYCRVSTDEEAQASSFELQVAHYTDYIAGHPDWELVKIYADEGISGTQMKHRERFLEMMEDCRAGRIDLIITKSISRFSRNVVDCLTCLRELKALPSPVEVIFEKERLSSLDDKTDMVLSLMASIAQEESRSISANIRWAYRNRMKDGTQKIPTNALLGYARRYSTGKGDLPCLRLHRYAPRDQWLGNHRATELPHGSVRQWSVLVLWETSRPDKSTAVGTGRLRAAVQATFKWRLSMAPKGRRCSQPQSRRIHLAHATHQQPGRAHGEAICYGEKEFPVLRYC
jgi:DNA invertase Pin-like site-specific DNA recombinase